jgi:hypothetical protein
MIYLTQLVYVVPGKENVFDEFEGIAIPLIAKYNGKLLLRVRPQVDDYIEANMEEPYEIHLVIFDNESDFENFGRDEERKKFLHLKEESIRSVLLIKGNKV